MKNYRCFGVRFLATCQIVGGPGWGLLKITDYRNLELLGYFRFEGIVFWIYLIALSALWFISGIGMWRFIEHWRKVSIGLYCWIVLDFLGAAIRIAIDKPASQLILVPSWESFFTVYLIVTLSSGGIALFLIRQKPVFR